MVFRLARCPYLVNPNASHLLQSWVMPRATVFFTIFGAVQYWPIRDSGDGKNASLLAKSS